MPLLVMARVVPEQDHVTVLSVFTEALLLNPLYAYLHATPAVLPVVPPQVPPVPVPALALLPEVPAPPTPPAPPAPPGPVVSVASGEEQAAPPHAKAAESASEVRVNVDRSRAKLTSRFVDPDFARQ
jgi:hypothetical protein